MAFDIYPNPLAPLKVPKNSSSSLIAITQRTGPDNVAEPGATVTSHPTTMFIRVALLSPLVDPTKPPTIILKVNTGDETEITGGYAPPTTIPDNGATGDAADGIRHDPDANRIFLIKVLVYGSGLTWQIRIKNNDVSADNSADHEFVWVIGDSLSESRQPWIDAPAATVQFDALTGQSPAPRLTVTVPNKGTGPLTITDLAGANAGDPSFKLAVVPAAPIEPNGTGDIKIDFIAPATIGDKNANYDIGSSDPNGLTGAAQSHNKRIPLHGVARQLEIALLVDASGSMGYTPKGPPEAVVADSDARWGKLKEAAKQFLVLLGTLNNGEGRFGIAVFPDFTAASYPASQAVCPSAGDIFTMQDINATNISKAQTNLDAPPPAGTARKAEQDKGATPIGFGIGHTMGTTAGSFGFFQGAEPAKSTNKRFLVLMTDGAQNCDFNPDVFYGTGNTSFQGKNIKVITVGYGTGDKATGFQVDPDLLKEIANQSLGTYLDSGADNAGLNLKKDFRTAITTGLSLDPTSDPTGVLTPNAPEVRQHIIITPYDTKAAFVVSWKTFNAQRVNVSILTPLCELITEATASKDPGITFEGHSTFVVFGFNNDYLRNASEPGSPRYGTWRLIITGNFSPPIGIAAAAVQDFEPFDYEVITESRLKLNLSADRPEFFAGDTINLTATITLDGKGVPNATTTVSLSAPGIPSDNFLAENKITAAEFSRTREQFANADVTATGIKIFALQQKDVLFVDLPRTIQFPMQDKGNGRYTAAFGSTSVPGNYEFYVTAIGQTEDGVSFRREKRLKLFIGVRPDPKFTLLETVFRTQIVGNQTIRFADVKVTLLDQFRNVKLVSDPDHDSSIQLTTTAGKFTGGLVWNLDGSYSQTVTYPAGVTPAIGLNVGGEPVIVARPLPSFDRLRYVDPVVDFRVGSEAAPGANKHRDPNAILGDPTLKATDVFLALGGLGNVTVAIDRQLMIAGQGDDDITVFVHPSDEPRPYAVDVLPITLPIPIFIPGLFHWVTLGTSPGVTQWFSLRQVGIKLCMAVRIRDLSRRTRNGLYQPDEGPGACFSGVGAKNTVNYPGGANDLIQLIERIIELLLQKHDG